MSGGLVFFSFWVLLGSSGFFWRSFWCSSGVLLVFDNTEEHQKNPEEPRRTPEEHQGGEWGSLTPAGLFNRPRRSITNNFASF